MRAVGRKVWCLLIFLALPGVVCSETAAKPGVALEVEVVDATGQAVASFVAGAPVHMQLRVTNRTQSRVELPFSSSKTHDVVVLGPDGNEVWRLSQGRMYAQMLSQLALEPGDSERFEAQCDPKQSGSTALAPGRYQVVGIIPTMGAELRSEPVDFVVDPAGDQR